MIRIFWTPLALDDLQGISIYIEGNSNLAIANRVCRSIYDAAQRVRRFPESGKVGLEEGTRELVVPQFPAYIVVYPVSSYQSLEIVRI